MPIATPLTTLLGIEHPILLAPMDFIAGARLTMAVSSAGGLGILGGGYGERAWLEAETAKLREFRHPFADHGGFDLRKQRGGEHDGWSFFWRPGAAHVPRPAGERHYAYTRSRVNHDGGRKRPPSPLGIGLGVFVCDGGRERPPNPPELGWELPPAGRAGRDVADPSPISSTLCAATVSRPPPCMMACGRGSLVLQRSGAGYGVWQRSRQSVKAGAFFLMSSQLAS